MLRRLWILTKHASISFSRDNCSQQAAAISYYALFSLVPIAVLIVSVAGFLLASETRRDDLVERVLDTVPLSDTNGRDAVRDALDSVQRVRGPAAAIGLVVTAFTASAMFGSVRRSMNLVWGVVEHRPYFRAKLVDLAQVGVLGGFLVASFVLTGFLRVVREVSIDRVGPLGDPSWLWEIPPILLPAVLTFVVFVLLYRYVPATQPRLRDALPGAAVATVLFELLKNAFAFYVANFNNYNVVYGSLGGLLLFLLNTYLASNIVLAGAEIARVFERYHAGELDSEIYPTKPMPPVAVRAFRAFKGLFVRQ